MTAVFMYTHIKNKIIQKKEINSSKGQKNPGERSNSGEKEK